jgi:hypothetical protein
MWLQRRLKARTEQSVEIVLLNDEKNHIEQKREQANS